jgi:hypothetical protein
MDVGQGPNWGCSAKGGEKKAVRRYVNCIFGKIRNENEAWESRPPRETWAYRS